jgi:hypothetical protein
MNLDGVWSIPGWGLAFAMWALAAATGVVIVAATALLAWRGRKRQR